MHGAHSDVPMLSKLKWCFLVAKEKSMYSEMMSELAQADVLQGVVGKEGNQLDSKPHTIPKTVQ